tara:strand:+ start:860 stop:1141 length:282 start_codon:yes stop_codon:yes gene_type:complete
MSERKLTKLQSRAMGVEWSPPEEQVKEMSDMIENIVNGSTINEKPFCETLIRPPNLMKMKKAELLKLASDMNCKVTMRNTKAQIVAAIENHSA